MSGIPWSVRGRSPHAGWPNLPPLLLFGALLLGALAAVAGDGHGAGVPPRPVGHGVRQTNGTSANGTGANETYENGTQQAGGSGWYDGNASQDTEPNTGGEGLTDPGEDAPLIGGGEKEPEDGANSGLPIPDSTDDRTTAPEGADLGNPAPTGADDSSASPEGTDDTPADLPEPLIDRVLGGLGRSPIELGGWVLVVAAGAALLVLAGAGMARVVEDKKAMDGIRSEIYEYIRHNPGAHQAGIMHEFDLSPSSIAHHLAVLEKADLVVPYKADKYRRYFVNGDVLRAVTGLGPRYKAVVSTLQNPTTRRIVRYLHRHPGTTQRAIAKAINLHPSTVNWHVNRLAAAGLVERASDTDAAAGYRTTGMEKVAPLLSALDAAS